MIGLEDITAARERVARLVHHTPLVRSNTLSERTGTNVYLKMELFQKTGSFKPRGAFNQLLVAMDATGARSFVGASDSNFAQRQLRSRACLRGIGTRRCDHGRHA